MNQKVILVFKTHFDIGFTDLAENVIQRYAGPMLENVIETCEGTADLGKLAYVWTMPAWPLKIMLERSGEKRDALERLVRSGRVAWHALPFTSHFDFCGPEEYIQGLRYARELSEHFGVPPVRSAKMTDVPGHGRMLPAVLAGAGVRFLHLGCNEYAKPPRVPPLFFWEAPDGSRVLTMYSPDGYGSSVLPPPDWEFPVWMALMNTQDNSGPQSASAIRSLAEKLRLSCPDAEIVSGTMDDFYRDLARCDLSGVPVVRGDLADSWIHGVGSYPSEVSSVRETRGRLARARELFALSGRGADEKARLAFTGLIDAAYGRLCLFGEHTWGLDVKTWMGPDRVYEKSRFEKAEKTERYQLMERSWDEQSSRARDAEKESLCALETAQGGDAWSVFNPGGSSFTGWADAGAAGEMFSQGARINGEKSPVETIFGTPHVFVRGLPALTARAAAPEAVPGEPLLCGGSGGCRTAENHRYRLEYSEKTGRISRVVDKKLGVSILEGTGGRGVFSYRYDKYGSDEVARYLEEYADRDSDWGRKDNGRENYPECTHETFLPRFAGVRVQGRTLCFRFRGSACAAYGDAEEIELRVTLPPFGEELFVELKLLRKQKTPFIESGSLVFPAAASEPRYFLNKNGSVLDPEKDIVENANHVFYCLEAYAAVQGKAGGVCIVAHDTPLLSIGETGVYRFRSTYEKHSPDLYFNLFNNMWGTNFPQWLGGDLSFRYTVFGCTDAASVTQRALSLASGAWAARVPELGPPVVLPEEVQVMTAEARRDGLLLRIRDTSGKRRTMTVRLKDARARIRRLDLLGMPSGRPFRGEISMESGPFAIFTLLIGEDGADGILP